MSAKRGSTDAVPALEDDRALTMRDSSSDEEELVVYTWREDRVRLISARKATASEYRQYEEPMKREYDFEKAKRGPVLPAPQGKTRITIRLDEEVIAWFREQVDSAGGGNYQTLINEVLREHIRQAREPLEETLRRVIREEIRRVS